MSNYTGPTELPPIESNVSVRLIEGSIATGVVTGHGQKDGRPTFDFEYDHRTHEGQILKASKWAWPEQVQRNLSNYIEHPSSGKTGAFAAKYDQHAERDGQLFTLLGAVDPKTYDAEYCGAMYSIRFADGAEIEAWPEEVESAMVEQSTVDHLCQVRHNPT